ncbi:phage terminase small subunit P27 family [Maliponia aquimaris]|uniref:Phage terminase, small subunit n=1 Tax=Maliponia aquimaris TaxID=1673631 RepID=A0A238KSE4_9RHOB|nr:phage terminase small subunit P27 family [Maliponia aquimaris]SMX45617.1 Phage terminase, small subunit [Maliponia aquimaris]
MARKHKPKPHTLAKTRLSALPRCPDHLSDVARKEWRRLATPMVEAGLLTLADRAALAAYCQAYGRWVEAEERLKETPALLKSPSGYVQQSPWLTVANKQLELMGRFMSELGLTPVARTRVAHNATTDPDRPTTIILRTIVNPGDDTGDAPIEHVKSLTLPGKDD